MFPRLDIQVSLGLVVALNYHNPFLNPYEEFQVFFIVIFAMFIYILYMDLPSHKSRLHIFFFICESLSLSFFIKWKSVTVYNIKCYQKSINSFLSLYILLIHWCRKQQELGMLPLAVSLMGVGVTLCLLVRI